MKLFQRMLLRKFSYYKVTRSREYKIVNKPIESASVAKLIDAKIQATGPITVAEYMKMVLTNPLTGYYMRRDVFGKKGDFITSPEISQMFGEIIAIWIYFEMSKIGMPKPWQLVELGPGRGTLAVDVLRVLKRLKATDDLSIHFVEISPHLASIQAQVLCNDVVSVGALPLEEQGQSYYRASETVDGIPIYWYKNLENVPKKFSVILAHEFLDALPIHKYQRVKDGWREVLITSTSEENGKVRFEYTLSQSETPISKLLIKKDETRDHLEICPHAGTLTKNIADRLEEEGGFALFVDYGHDGTKSDTFRAFKNHKLHDPLIDPGTADLTADVDFSFLREFLKQKMLVFGPVEQGDFLLRLGIKHRLDMLLKVITDEKTKETVQSGYKMMVDKSEMGERYKCMAAFPKVLHTHLEKFPVAGFFDKELNPVNVKS